MTDRFASFHRAGNRFACPIEAGSDAPHRAAVGHVDGTNIAQGRGTGEPSLDRRGGRVMDWFGPIRR